MKQRIGFIGLGIMGRHMAGHLLDAGYEVVAYDIVASAVEPGRSQGRDGVAPPARMWPPTAI